MSLKVKIGADGSQFMREIAKINKAGSSMGDKMKQAGKAAGVGILAIGAAATASAVAVAALGVKMINIGENANASDDRVKNITKSMGLFGEESDKVAERINNLADKIEVQTGMDGDAIQMTQAKLLTFKELAKTADQMGGNFDRATQAAVDMAAAGFGAAETNAVQLGKALQDPIKGITALARSGVTFTAQEKDKIQVLVQSNRMLEAQDEVLKAIETQVGGTAAATGTGMSKIKAAIGLVIEEGAKPLARGFQVASESIVEVFPKILAGITAIAPKIKEFGRQIGLSISDAVQGDSERLVAIGQLIGDLIKSGIGIALSSAWTDIGIKVREGLSGEFMGIPIMPPKFNETTKEAKAAKEGLAGMQSSQAIESAKERFRSIQAIPQAGTTQGQFGGEFRYAQPGELSLLKDAQGRMLIELKRIADNTGRPTFATP